MKTKKKKDEWKREVWSFDTETTGLNVYKGAKMFAFCLGNGATGEVEVHRVDTKSLSQRKRALERLQDFFDDVTIIKVAHNLKFDYTMIVNAGIKIPEDTEFHDTMLLSQCLRNDERSHSLDKLAIKYGGNDMRVYEDFEVARQAKLRGGYQFVDHDLMKVYQEADGERTLLLYFTMVDALKQRGELAWNDYLNEVKLALVTAKMESVGLKFKKARAFKLSKKLKDGCDEAEKQLVKKYTHGTPINLNSGKQVGKLLYKDMGFPVVRKTETGQPATDLITFEELHRLHPHDIFDLLRKYKSYSKGLQMLETYFENECSDGRIHPNLKTNHAGTGRQACDNPNLQNVSKEKNEHNKYAVPLRSVIGADKDEFFGFVDYAGIEMRLIIDATKEPELMEVLKSNGDVHRPTMECFVEAKGKEWTPRWAVDFCNELKKEDAPKYKSLRGLYKNVGFCVAYGGGDQKVAMTIGKDYEEIEGGCRRYRLRFPRISSFCTTMIREVNRKGFIETPFGRRLYIPKQLAYTASNYMIQGTAAGILKRAEVRVHKLLKQWNDSYPSFPVNMIMTIHDELIFSFHKAYRTTMRKEFKEVLGLIRERMINDLPEINAPLDVEWKFTSVNGVWSQTKEIKI